MKRLPIYIAAIAAVSLLVSPPRARATETSSPANIAPSCIITSSSSANPVWSASKAADGSYGPTDGWLGEWGTNMDRGPWISFTLPSRAVISGIELMQASLQEASKNRFSRPKKITVELTDGVDTKQLVFTLRDAETELQTLKFAPLPADTVIVRIDDVYPGASISASAGFQEIRIIGTITDTPRKYAPSRLDQGDPAETHESVVDSGSDGAKDYKPSTIAEPIPGEGWRTESPGGSGDSNEKRGTLSRDEKEILDLLRELIDRLEKKFMED